MGSFYSTCSISGMTLTHQRTSVQLLVSGYSTEIGEGTDMIVSNEGAQAFYSPFGFPIHGYYYDYGYLHGIIEDDNTRMLEKYFGISIEDIIKGVGRPGDISGIKNEEFFNKLSLTYFRTEVLEFLQQGWNDIDINNPRKYSGEERLKQLFDRLNTDTAKKVKSLEDQIKELPDDNSSKELFILTRQLFELTSQFDTIYHNSYIRVSGNKNMFNVLPIDTSFKEYILKQYQFIMNLGFKLQRLLIPSNYGSQEDNWIFTYRLNEMVNDLLADDIKNSEYYDESEDREARSIALTHQRNKNLRKLGV